MARPVTPAGRAWARFDPVTLIQTPRVDLEAEPGLRQALADGIERGYAGEIPSAPPGAECSLLRVGGETVGVLAFLRDAPEAGQAAVHAVAIDPAHRGHSYAVKALLAAERRLSREGLELLARVPRTNGRGLYFMLRAGFVPVPVAEGEAGADVTWFRRGTTVKQAASAR